MRGSGSEYEGGESQDIEDLLAEIKVMKEAKDYYGADRESEFQ